MHLCLPAFSAPHPDPDPDLDLDPALVLALVLVHHPVLDPLRVRVDLPAREAPASQGVAPQNPAIRRSLASIVPIILMSVPSALPPP